MMDQMTSDLHGVVIKLKTVNSRIVYNTTQARIMQEVLTEDGTFQILFTLFLELQSSGKYGYNRLWPLDPLM